jgi:hypothetical protein
MDMKYGRKPSSIKKDIREKLEEWVDSIADEHVADLVRLNAIVAGGCITSMLLGEEVNDYDVYFTESSTAETVRDYYIKLQNLNTKAGTAFGGYNPVFVSSNAITLSDKIQVITKYTGTPELLQKNFDFSHTKCWYDWVNDHLELYNKALTSITSRSLIYEGSEYPLASLFRMRKFMRRGWRVSAGQMFKIAFEINQIGDFTDFKVLQEQLIGVDMSYMLDIIETLRVANPEDIDATYVMQIVDKIFEEE